MHVLSLFSWLEMADEPESLVLIQLREMRAEMRDMRASIDENTRVFMLHDKRLDDVLEAAVLASGYANLAVHKFDLMENRVERLETRVGKLE